LDRLGRNLRHLVLLLDEWPSRGIAFVTLGEGIDTSAAAGRLVAGVLGSIAEIERARIQTLASDALDVAIFDRSPLRNYSATSKGDPTPLLTV
jgi:DNA invertase Pin-like site-specific DNA recombinase